MPNALLELYGFVFSCDEFHSPDHLYFVLKAEVPKHDNDALDVGAKLDSSTGISDNAGGWYLGFEFSPSSALQDHTSPQLGRKSESNGTQTGFAIFDQNLGELKSAHSWPGNLVSCFNF